MANIEKVIEKLESLGFIEVVLSTTEVFWQKKDIKVKFIGNRLIASQYEPNLMSDYSAEINLDDADMFSEFERNVHLTNISQW